jgi:hypothetical protein
LTPDGVLLLPLSGPDRVMDAVLSIAGALRPAPSTYCAAIEGGDGGDGASHVESALMAAQAAASAALHEILSTDARERRIRLMTPEPDLVASALAAMILASYDAMTERQRQMIRLIKDSETQQQVATHLGVTRQAVNQSLAAAGWPYLRRAEEAMRDCLARRSRVPAETSVG